MASAPATSASGVTIQLTTGIATALAIGETSDNWWNSTTVAGISASVTATCTRAPAASARRHAGTARFATRPCTHPHDRGHRAERQPEAGGEHGPRIDEAHDRRRERERRAEPDARAGEPRAGDDGEHQHRALRGDAPAGEQRVADGGGEAREHAGHLRRRAADERRRPPPDRSDAPAGEARDHRDVQPRDADEVRDPGAVEERPVLRRDRALVADDQREQHAAVAPPFEHRREAVAQRVARALGQQAGPVDARIDQPRRRIASTGAHRHRSRAGCVRAARLRGRNRRGSARRGAASAAPRTASARPVAASATSLYQPSSRRLGTRHARASAPARRRTRSARRARGAPAATTRRLRRRCPCPRRRTAARPRAGGSTARRRRRTRRPPRPRSSTNARA